MFTLDGAYFLINWLMKFLFNLRKDSQGFSRIQEDIQFYKIQLIDVNYYFLNKDFIIYDLIFIISQVQFIW